MCILSSPVRLRFSNQPLNEVILSLSSKDQLPISVDFAYDMGRTAEPEGVISRTERLYQAPGIATAGAVFATEPSIMGSFALSFKEGVQIQVQSDLTRVSWSSTSGLVYPHFEALVNSAETFQAVFEKVVGARRKFIVVNLNYSNSFRLDNDVTLVDYIERKFLPESIVEQPLISLYSWRTERCDMRIQITVEPKSREVTLLTAAGLMVDETDEFKDNAWILNKELNVLFNELITERAKTEWRLEA